MNRTALVKKLVRQAGLTSGAAADEVDRLVTRIVKNLRRGRTVSVPGLGTVTSAASAALRARGAGRRPGK